MVTLMQHLLVTNALASRDYYRTNNTLIRYSILTWHASGITSTRHFMFNGKQDASMWHPLSCRCGMYLLLPVFMPHFASGGVPWAIRLAMELSFVHNHDISHNGVYSSIYESIYFVFVSCKLICSSLITYIVSTPKTYVWLACFSVCFSP